MFWNPLLTKTLCRSAKWPALHYIYQNPESGEWVASDNRILLAEDNGTPPLAEWWNADGTPANMLGLEYPYEKLIRDTLAGINLTAPITSIKPKGTFTFIGSYATTTDNFNKILSFIGNDGVVKYHKEFYQPVYFESSDKKRRALAMPFKRVDNGFRVLDVDENLITVCDSYEQAESVASALGIEYIIKEKGELND